MLNSKIENLIVEMEKVANSSNSPRTELFRDKAVVRALYSDKTVSELVWIVGKEETSITCLLNFDEVKSRSALTPVIWNTQEFIKNGLSLSKGKITARTIINLREGRIMQMGEKALMDYIAQYNERLLSFRAESDIYKKTLYTMSR